MLTQQSCWAQQSCGTHGNWLLEVASMVASLARNWWLLAIRGIAAILFGLAALIWPGPTLTVLVLLFGAYALVDGVFGLVAGIRRAAGGEGRWGWLVVEGLLGIAAGIAAFVWPGLTALVLLYLIAAWAILTGVFELVSAIRLRQEITGEVWLALGGLASIVFGILLLVYPSAGALAVVWIIGVYGILFGVLLLGLAFRLRRWHAERQTGLPAT
jgi:uncharacterized membrane protein HdeD (DUF308 family)